jgi:gliding motility-associated-like protein
MTSFQLFSALSPKFIIPALLLPLLSFASGGTNPLKIISPHNPVCAGEYFLLKATGGSGYAYAWQPSQLLDNPAIAEPKARIFDNTTFSVIRTNLSTDARDTAFVEVVVLKKAFEINAPKFICRGIEHELSIPANLVQPVWNTGFAGHVLKITRGGYYSFKAISGCHLVEGNVFIRDIDKPISKIIAAGQPDICEGQSIELTAVSLENISWSTGGVEPKIVVSNPGTYTLTNSNECGSVSDQIEIRTHKVTAAYLPKKWEDKAPYNHIVYNHSQNASYFEWYLNDEKISMEKQPVLYLPNEGTYFLKLLAIDNYGCKDEVSYAPIYVHSESDLINPDQAVLIPNSFSPNGDGLNDHLQFLFQGVKRLDATVFDRWGNEVYQFNGATDRWNGNNKNDSPMPQDMYTLKYSFILEDGQTVARTTQVYLLR